MTDQQVAARVASLLKQMTVEEKVGQLVQLPGAYVPDANQLEDRLRKGMGGSVLWVRGPAALNKLQKIVMNESRLRIPLIFGLDVIHGYRNIFPMPLAMAASWDPSLVERAQTVAAREARAAGIHWTFAPMVDIARDARWGRMIEGAGEDPYLGAAMARAQVRGFQGAYVGAPGHVLACAKHFAGYGAPHGGRDYDSVYLSDTELYNVYLPPFKAAVDAGVGSLMSAYMDLNDVPATANRFLLREILRDRWGFRGFVVSDALAVGNLLIQGHARDRADAALRGFKAGTNMDMASGAYMENIAKMVASGQISMAELDEMVRPVLEAKIRLGLFENPYVDEAAVEKVLSTPEHRALTRVAAVRSAVLLRNEGGLLPLAKTPNRSIAVIGPLANDADNMLTDWARQGDPKDSVTVYEGIRNKLGAGARVEFAPAVQLQRRYPSMFPGPAPKPWTEAEAGKAWDDAIALAKRSDLIVLALGELSSQSGEAASQSTIEFPGRQQELMETVVALGKPVVLVLINGRPLNLVWASTHVPAILEAWHPGTEGGNAIADLLFGDAVPGGKLPVTWPRHVGQVPIYYAHNLSHQPEGSERFTSRYWDEPSSPLYPFGYGLSYTTFEYSNLRLKRPQVKLGEKVEVSVDVRNSGKMAGDEVVQLYIHQRAGKSSRPVRLLKGFERVTLKPGETRTVSFVLGQDELSYWSTTERAWIQETEAFDVWAGGDSTAKLHGEFRVVQ
jgi:beta-glucosidase